MSLFEDAMAVAVQLPQTERERLARALGVTREGSATGRSLPLQQVPRADPAAWRKAEAGHAVLATSAAATGYPEGPRAIAGMWSHRAETQLPTTEAQPVSGLRKGSPVVVHTDVCVDLATGYEPARRFFEEPVVEVRLATACYLALLDAAEDQDQVGRLQSFVRPYAVLSLGPMASSRAVELMAAHALPDGLSALDALIAATALAHEIPLVAAQPRAFMRVPGLMVCSPYPSRAA